MWDGLSAFEHAQCTLLAHGLPLVKLSLPCSLSPLSLRLGLQSSYVLFLFFLVHLIRFELASTLIKL